MTAAVNDPRDTWAEALRCTREILGEDDYYIVQGFQSPEQLLLEVHKIQQQNARGTVSTFLNTLIAPLTHLKSFAVALVGATTTGSVSLACFWGVLFLLIQLASKSDDTFREVKAYLVELSENIETFEIYQKSLELDQQILDRFLGVLVDMVLCSANAIKHFRKADIRAPSLSSWDDVNKRFSKNLQEFASRIDHLKKQVEARQFAKNSLSRGEAEEALKLRKPTLDAQQRAVRLPYFQLPSPGRNSRFFGRTDLLSEIHELLKRDPGTPGVRSVAIWGVGGIGKSQVALEYASRQILEKCPLVLWIPAQTETEMSRALVKAAGEVRPPGYDETMSADRIRYLMSNWLQVTDVEWLMIFDNVDDNDMLTSNWPSTGNGQILMTCRSELVAACPAAHAVEVRPFNREEGGALLLRVARKQVPNKDDEEVARELSVRLGGLALALEITGSQIFMKKKPMREFLSYFDQNWTSKDHWASLRKPPRYATKNPYYNKTLLTVWQTAFESLSENSAKLMGLICFFAPDDIPRRYIHTKATSAGTWSFLTDMEGYEEAEGQLLSVALIKINEETEMISLHRLVQEAYYYYMDEERQRETVQVAFRVLCAAFPRRELRRQMYEVWELCELLIHHIEATQDKYEDLREAGMSMQDSEVDMMLADATWFCGETSSLVLGEKLGKRAADNCADKTSLLYAYLCESVATIDHRRGWYQTAYEFFVRSLEIREKVPTTTGPELADAHSAVGLALFGLFRSEEAINAVDKALAIAYAAPHDQRRTYNIDRYLRNRSRPQAALGRFDVARSDVAAAEDFQTLVYKENSHFHGETAYILGKIAAKEGQWQQAADYLQRAYDLQYPGKPTHQSVASARYHQALVCLQKPGAESGSDEQALRYLRQALEITQFNEARRGDQGESARVKWLISKIWERQGRAEDAEIYRTEALKTKKELERTGRHPKSPDAEQEWDCFSDLVDR